jgi:putative FmdB family regulatory protein
MPTYVYGCDTCGHQFEQFQKISDDPVRECPRCQNKVRRIFQPAGIVFKGSGWHITDYKRGSQATESSTNGVDESSTNGGEKSGNGKSADAKTSTTSDQKSESSNASKSDAGTAAA